MHNQTHESQNPIEVLTDLARYALSETKSCTLSDYSIGLQMQCRELVRILLSKAGYITLILSVLAGFCETARVFAAELAPKLFPNLSNSPGWTAYLNSSPLAMAVCGSAIVIIGYIVYRYSVEKYKARRGLESLYPKYRCSKSNIAISILAAIVPSTCIALDFYSNNVSSALLIHAAAFILSTLRICTLMPTSVSFKKRTFRMPAGMRLISTLLFLALLGAPLAYIFILLDIMYPKSNATFFSLFLLMFGSIWLIMLGIDEIKMSTRSKRKESSATHSATEREDVDMRTHLEWAMHSALCMAVKFICLFISLCLIMVMPAFLIYPILLF